jgi:hypothetical protein
MRVSGSIRAAIAGGVGAAAFMTAAAAIAGSGIGGVFSLGQTNTVNAVSTLSGASPGASLQLANSGTGAGATGLGITVPAGKPALKVSTTVLNHNLNADLLDGLHASGVSRVTETASSSFVDSTPQNTEATATLTAPAKGFVHVTATFVATDAFLSPTCNSCLMEAVLHDETADARSPLYLQRFGRGGGQVDDQAVALDYVFPVTAPGSRSYSLDTFWRNDFGNPENSGAVASPVITAQFVPFGGTGSATTLASPAARRSAR